MNREFTGMEYKKTVNFFEYISTSDSSSFRKNVLLALAEFFNYEHATFFITNEQGQLTDPLLLNIDSNFMYDYLEYYHRTDIFYPNNAITLDFFRKKAALTITDIMPYKQFEETEFYHDFLKKQNLYHELALALFYGDKMVGGIGLFKPKGDNFSEDDMQRVKTLSKSIAAMLYHNLETNKELQYKELYEVSFSNAPVGMIIFNKELKIVYANSLSLLLGQRIFNKKITQQELVKLVLQQMGKHWMNGGHRTILSTSLAEFKVRILPLEGRNRELGQEPSFLLTITPETVVHEDPLRLKDMENFGLTRREVEILPLVLKGMTNQEIAAELFVAPVTVKAHLQRIFKKMGVGNRTSLCHKVNMLKKKL